MIDSFSFLKKRLILDRLHTLLVFCGSFFFPAPLLLFGLFCFPPILCANLFNQATFWFSLRCIRTCFSFFFYFSCSGWIQLSFFGFHCRWFILPLFFLPSIFLQFSSFCFFWFVVSVFFCPFFLFFDFCRSWIYLLRFSSFFFLLCLQFTVAVFFFFPLVVDILLFFCCVFALSCCFSLTHFIISLWTESIYHHFIVFLSYRFMVRSYFLYSLWEGSAIKRYLQVFAQSLRKTLSFLFYSPKVLSNSRLNTRFTFLVKAFYPFFICTFSWFFFKISSRGWLFCSKQIKITSHGCLF